MPPLGPENLKVDLNVMLPKPKVPKFSFSNCTTPVFSSVPEFDDTFFPLPSSVAPVRFNKRRRESDENANIIQAIPFSPKSKMLCV
jgi:hypothetical protein